MLKYFVVAFTAICILGLDLTLSLHDLKAATTHAAQIHRDYPGAIDRQAPCPAGATVWCRNVGGLDE